MKIRTQFIVTMAMFGLVLLAVAASVVITNQEVERLNTQEETAFDIEREASELSYLSNDYLLFREDPQHVRWESKWASLSDNLSKLDLSGSEERVIANNMKANHQRLKVVFDNISSIFEGEGGTSVKESSQSLTQVSWSRMAVQNQGIAFDASQLSQVLRDRKDELKQTNSLLVFALLGGFGAYFIANYLVVSRRLLRSIANLQDGTKVIGSGDLDFTLETKSNDEIGELSRAFNRMTADLKRVTASKAELEKEVEKRKAAEEALHDERERLAVTLASIGDGVIATDIDANTVFLNGVAEELTGWTQKEASGRPLSEVFDIVNEETRVPAPDPVAKALRSGLVVGLANHTALIAKDGRERSIADSCAPIRAADGSIIGAVLVFRDITEEKKAEEIRINLHRQAEYELEIPNLLLKAANTLGESIDLGRVLDSLADIVLEVTGKRRIGIFLLNKETYDLEAKATCGESAIPVGSRFNLKQLAPKVQHVIYDKRSQVIDYEVPEIGDANKSRAKSLSIKVSLVVPLLYKGDVLGLLALDNPGERQTVSERDIALVEGIAAQAAVAIANARLFETERHIAETLQEALITTPKELPGISFGHLYRSATEAAKVGGDFYDIFEVDDGRIGILIGDVAGKGVSAATLTVFIENTIKAFTHLGFAPCEALSRTNEIMLRSSGDAVFVTLFFGILNTEEGLLCFCNAGHPPPFVRRKSRKVDRLQGASPVLGAFDGVSFAEATTHLGKDDVLVLYTDGTVEARSGDGAFFGEERLLETVKTPKAAPDMPQHIFDTLIGFTGGKFADDMALLSISLTE
ncbi:MAG: SpoIIE family protein phosphatase [Candidatus Aquicultorales bacterium]